MLRLLTLVCLAPLVACNSSAPDSHDLGGDLSSTPATALNAFVGTWKVTGGQSHQQCPGGPVMTNTDSGSVETITAPSADTIVVSATLWNDFVCSYEFSVSGNTATLKPGQAPCNLERGMVCGATKTTQMLQPRSDTLMLVDDNTLQETFAYDYLHSDCDDHSCTLNGTDQYARQ